MFFVIIFIRCFSTYINDVSFFELRKREIRDRMIYDKYKEENIDGK